MLYKILTIVFLTISSITSLPLQPQDEGDRPLSKEDLLESSEELASEELASLLRDIQEVVKDEPSVMSLEEYDYNMEVSNQEDIVLVEKIQEDTQYNYIYEDSIPGVNIQEELREEEDVGKVKDNSTENENKEIMSDEFSYVVEDDGKVVE